MRVFVYKKSWLSWNNYLIGATVSDWHANTVEQGTICDLGEYYLFYSCDLEALVITIQYAPAKPNLNWNLAKSRSRIAFSQLPIHCHDSMTIVLCAKF